jgi:acetolactate synthase-1/2/3 large subunit
MKVSDYIVSFLQSKKINTAFTITGGFAMHLNDSFGNSSFQIYYQHHEQACGYAAVGYTKACNIPSIVCTTAGVAAMNAISPCLVAYQDSIPILFISGQVKSTETIRTLNKDNIKLRHYAGADCDIISSVAPITKFSHEITCVSEVPDVLNKAYQALVTGRPGPVWLSIPVDIQGLQISAEISIFTDQSILNSIDLSPLYTLLKNAKRPLLLVGNGVKLAGCRDQFSHFIDVYRIPFVTTILSSDLIETDNNLNCGKVGLIGDRYGNFTLQNCDLLISLGCRMAQGIVGYRADWFARDAKVVYIDNDPNELAKTNIEYSLKLNVDLKIFFNDFQCDVFEYSDWLNKTAHWKAKWSFELPPTEDIINPYYALKELYTYAPPNKITIASSGSIVTNVWHMLQVKTGDRFLHSSQGDMGFELPAAIGAQIAEPSKSVITILGEGSLQLNIQELQTILHYKLPIKILIFNNASYGAISLTQTNFFKTKFGVDTSSGLSFPDTEKIANAYGIPYMSSRNYEEMSKTIQTFIHTPGPILLEIFCCIQTRYPRLNAIKNDDGTFTNRPYEDMYPFMDRDEFTREMIVTPI